MKDNVRIIRIMCVAALLLAFATAFVACATEESALKEKYEQAGFDAQAFPFEKADVDKDLVDFAYHGIKNANSSNVEQVFVITFKSIDEAKTYFEKHVKDKDKPNMIRYGRAVVYGSKEAVDLY